MKDARGTARQSQLINTYGIGSIIATGNETFMIAGLDTWPPAYKEEKLYEPRLAQRLGVRHFCMPPASKGRGVGSVVFPQMTFCTGCRRLDYRSKLVDGDKFVCRDCTSDLSPSRFVVACNRGHVDDFPYSGWVHQGKRPDGKHDMKLLATGGALSLAGLEVHCSCGVKRSLAKIFNRGELGLSCTGRTPWLQTKQREQCDERMVTMQRGASSVWGAKVESAITIPPWSSEAVQWMLDNAGAVGAMQREAIPAVLKGMFPDLTDDDARYAVRAYFEPVGDSSLLAQEYKALLQGTAGMDDKTFVASRRPVPPSAAALGVSALVKAERIREVRALYGFVRGKGDPESTVASSRTQLSRREVDWLPGVEVIGEGVFVDFAGARVDAFLQSALSKERHAEQAVGTDIPASARYVLVHSLAHGLMAEFANYGGYPLASLKERIYAGEKQAGVLIYTSTSDSAGSLGGLAALAEPGQFEVILDGMIRRLTWCTNDPVCIESHQSGVDGRNMAACHACMLAPEVSCERRNSWLDRALLVGTLARPKEGFLTA